MSKNNKIYSKQTQKIPKEDQNVDIKLLLKENTHKIITTKNQVQNFNSKIGRKLAIILLSNLNYELVTS